MSRRTAKAVEVLALAGVVALLWLAVWLGTRWYLEERRQTGGGTQDARSP